MNERVFNKSADTLRSPERVKRLEVSRVVELCLNGQNIKSVLDIGAGTGLFAEEFIKKGIHVAAIDRSLKMIDAFKNILPGVEIKNASAENIPYGLKSFDLIFFGLVFHEVDDYKKAMEETYRVAKKEAVLLEWEYKTQEFGPPLEHRLKEDFILKLAEKAGFKNSEIYHLENLVLYKFFK